MRVYDLWLPILLSGLATHILSTLSWTVLPHHKPEWNRLPAEDDLHAMLIKRQTPPGQYLFPFAADGKEANTESFKQKSAQLCGMLVIWPNPIQMGKAIGLTLASFMIIAFVIGYLASLGLPRGAEFVRVAQFVTTAGLLAHISAKFPFVFWFRRKIGMDVFDGVVFAIVTGLLFAATWPQ